MSRHVKREFRWDRIFLVVLVLIGCSSGMVALVSSPDEVTSKPKSLSHPEPLKKLKGYRIPDKHLAIAPETLPVELAEEVVSVKNKEDFKIGSLDPCSCCKKTLRIPKNPYTRHQESARSLPNSFFIKDEAAIKYGLSVNKLVEVHDGRGYRIKGLRYSSPMLLPDVRDLLEDMGNDYADALEGTDSEGTVFRVTSMTRTENQQKTLARRNRNATRGESSHNFGASFDIAFMDRASEAANCNRPTREIQKLLLRYQDEGRILIIPEGGCMHITLLKVK
ncbi:MAG TPA: hypothetical protein EYN67_03185 [Flavobacteriales bacterium]|nr:hypothetical protein [Flavobacteriales bacterium]HIO15345.1 hypothetical protein [Flavobacteriales bacterium]